ncbi:MAG: hypothetical protein EZS28_021507 [Streblomastix strix]|uniref:Uncharacterized protein n=1 Tax=Streblomastix strix TaxID=222440 RepID=A0A5J4VK39_9EUKA|nr:MAG: hypothetical protein EZS28_021507 [Streblomastix strix]
MSNWKHNAILMSACTSTDYNMLQCMPETKPFVLLSRYGYCRCAVPVRYDQIQFRDLGMRTFSSVTSATNFGHRWTSPQTQFFPLYDEYEGNAYRKYVQMEIEEELGENGTLPLVPLHPILRYHIPVYPLRFGKFINAQMLFGSSQLPLQAENLKWKTLEPWQIRKAVTMMGAEGDVRQRWQLSERQRVRKQLSLQSADDENSDQNQICVLNQQEKDEQKKNQILLLKEIRNKEHEDETIKRFNQLQFDVKEINQQLNDTSDQTFKIISQPQLSLLKRKVKLLATNIYPEITPSNVELTIHQPTIMQLQEQTSPQYQKQNIVLNTLSVDTLEHPITLNSIHHAELQDRLLKIPKEYL